MLVVKRYIEEQCVTKYITNYFSLPFPGIDTAPTWIE